MSSTTDPTVEDGFRSVAERKKRLGQYFTGVRLARLLAALAGAHTASSVIDPMVGTGDMLLGCLEHGATPSVLAGIEIDPIAQTACLRRLNEAGASEPIVLLGSAFSPDTLRELPTTAWEVCITNPPYVRYQSTAREAGGDMRLPSAPEIRRDLIASIDELSALDAVDREMFKTLAKSYSGLADLAVPSWILCAGLVEVGGTLAMLVPTTWLNRDYAHPVQYVLARWFDVRFVVEDADAAWFSDALVRTTLVVATRIERRDSAFAPTKTSGFLHLKLGRGIADGRSLVGAACPDDDDPDLTFALEAEQWQAKRRVPNTAPVSGVWVPASHGSSALHHAISAEAWLAALEPSVDAGRVVSRRSTPSVPLALVAAIGSVRDGAYTTLEEVGWRVGQGLRTGANQFFYGEVTGKTETGELVATSSVLDGRIVEVPSDALRAVLRRQSDLPNGFSIRAAELKGRVLILDDYALSEDAATDGSIYHRTLPKPLAEFIRGAAEVNVGTDEQPKFIPGLSAVITNVRAANPAQPEVVPRFWYQLPPFTDRHRPNLALARVNHTHPKTYLNERCASIVDANFSTLWAMDSATADEYALLALMNSSWSIAAMEGACTVLGGGALKVEAAHLRRLPIPILSASGWKKLSKLGVRLATASDGSSSGLLRQIDLLVLSELVGPDRAEQAIDRINQVAAEKLRARSH